MVMGTKSGRIPPYDPHWEWHIIRSWLPHEVVCEYRTHNRLRNVILGENVK
jgi:hypothetical protein